ncbi:Glycosylphosphatidylinositol anchor biosynthesis protein 11 [Talaromyces atroroseus]|uniref:Glycosylphosphatidylinositol anchor biosynthesis protein 11 n=1 Tax=Talaromyces atroroseus TaxID=1441469 RepID=A0A1Q5QBT7_TALAT|nr:Glycosylphosphatidylinositol anchor biosynthesis protein 11 [Talaromyces atroroseus]OKL63412.1 Glycosylphosphatidylinositol anchor biosynthesis protein 11 [Talaromyces atroroseus]
MATTPPSSTVSHTGPAAVNILPNSAAQAYAHVHPTLLLAVYAIRFPALVADPASTLLNDLPLYTALQVVYVVTCLPQAGSVHHHHTHEGDSDVGGIKPGKAPYRKKHASANNKSDTLFQKLTAAFLSLTLTLLLGTPALALLLILFGAPFTTHNAHTILCAAHMALLSVTPLVYVHGVEGSAWKEIWAFARPSDAVWGGALGACLGAWLGAVPIPLDWDRPWQAYPITILTGAYLGYALGQLIGRTPLLYGKRVEFA